MGMINTLKNINYRILTLVTLCLMWFPTVVLGEPVNHISPLQAKALMDAHIDNPDFIIIDIRTPLEYRLGHLPNARLLNYYSKEFLVELKRLDKNKTYLFYCHNGGRSGYTMGLIEKMGFRHVYHLARGIVIWRRENLPVKTE
jgi:rhodanese-related sulfurtransferase